MCNDKYLQIYFQTNIYDLFLAVSSLKLTKLVFLCAICPVKFLIFK